jgi:hypothetical protein
MTTFTRDLLDNQPIRRARRAHRERMIILTAFLMVLCFQGWSIAHAQEFRKKALSQHVKPNAGIEKTQAYFKAIKEAQKLIK